MFEIEINFFFLCYLDACIWHISSGIVLSADIMIMFSWRASVYVCERDRQEEEEKVQIFPNGGHDPKA